LRDEYPVTTFEVGQDKSIVILAATEWELSQPFYYEVRVNGEVVVPKFLICGGKDDGKFKFNVMSAKGGHLVGVFAEKYPREVLALHDFSENLPSGSV